MSVLETFYISVELESDKANKQTETLKKNVDKLEKSFSSTDKITNKFSNSLTGLIKTLGGAVIAFASLGSIISGIRSSVHAADELGKLAEATDLNVESLSAWGDAVKKNGGSVESFGATVKGLTTSIVEFSTKGKSRLLPFFQELNVHMLDSKNNARSVFDILPDLADSFQKIGKAESFGIGQKLGLDIGTITLLQKGKSSIDDIIKRQKELGIITKKNAEIAAKFNDRWDDTAHIFRTLFLNLSTYVIPPLIRVLEIFEKAANYISKHSDIIVAGLIAISVAITAFVLPAFVSLLVAASPFILIATAIIGLAAVIGLLYEDIKYYVEGNNSALGKLIEKFPMLEVVVHSVITTVQFLFNVFKAMWGFFIDLFVQPERAWENFKFKLLHGLQILLIQFPLLKKVVDFISLAFEKMGNVVEGVFNRIISVYSKLKEILGMGENQKQVQDNFEKSLFNKRISYDLQNTQGALSFANRHPLNSMSSSAIFNNGSATKNTTVNINDINIETQATDADGIAGAIAKSFDVQLNQASGTFDDGVRI